MAAIRMSHPKHGFHVVYDNSDVERHKQHGWSVHEASPAIVQAPNTHDLSVDIVEDTLKAYFAKFGKKPHHMMKFENILKAINGDS